MSSEAGVLTVGDRLKRIEDRIEQVILRMDKLAEDADMRALDTRVDMLEREGSIQARKAEADVAALGVRVQSLETERAVYMALRSNRRLVIGVVLGMAGWASAVVAAVTMLHR